MLRTVIVTASLLACGARSDLEPSEDQSEPVPAGGADPGGAPQGGESGGVGGTGGEVTGGGGCEAAPIVEWELSGAPLPATSDHDPIQIAVGTTHTCVLFGDQSMKCWGSNEDGQLGLEDTSPRGDLPGNVPASLEAVNLGAARTARFITAGFNTTCAILDTAQVKCWGANTSGVLGLGDTQARGDRPGTMGDALPVVDLGSGARARKVLAANYHVCALLEDGRIKCWGDTTVTGAEDPVQHGDAPGTMGDALPAVWLGEGRRAIDLFSGYNTACALLDDFTVKCWGGNDSGQLGQGDNADRGLEARTMGDDLSPIDLGAHGWLVAPSSYSTCALTVAEDVCGEPPIVPDLSRSFVKCWGNGSDLGLGTEVGYGDDPSEMGENLPFVELGTGRTATQLSCGARWTCALLDDRRVKCWGYNATGQLGRGDIATVGDAPSEMGNDLPYLDLGTGQTTSAIYVGGFHGCAILDNRQLKCWGANGSGQLGLGDTQNRGDTPGAMGDALPAVSLR